MSKPKQEVRLTMHLTPAEARLVLIMVERGIEDLSAIAKSGLTLASQEAAAHLAFVSTLEDRLINFLEQQR